MGIHSGYTVPQYDVERPDTRYTGPLACDVPLGNGDAPCRVYCWIDNDEFSAASCTVKLRGVDVSDLLVNEHWDAIEAYIKANRDSLVKDMNDE